jgi:adenosine deaminase
MHPLRELIDHGLMLTINSDDPAMFGSTITDEFINLYDNFEISLLKMRQLTKNAINSAFVANELNEKMSQIIDSFWTKYNS